jgi:ABC-type Zn uptake system ZnuABC Zn-binding protein ZnuA
MKWFIVLVLILGLTAGVWVFRARLFPAPKEKGESLVIVTTTQELAVLAKTVAGAGVAVTSLGLSGAGSIPNSEQEKEIAAADMFIFEGDKSDPWTDALSRSLNKQGIVPIKASAGGTAWPRTAAANRQLAERVARVLEVIDVPHADVYAHNVEQYTGTTR